MSTLQQMADLGLFPTASAVSKIESIYGESPSEVYSELYTDTYMNESSAAQYDSDAVDGDEASMSVYGGSVLLSPEQGMTAVPALEASQATPYISIYERSSIELSQSLYSNTSLTDPNLSSHFSRNTTYEQYLKEKGHNSDPPDYLTPHIQQRKEAIRQRKSEILDRKAWFEKTVENIFKQGGEHSGTASGDATGSASTVATNAADDNASSGERGGIVKKKYKVHMYSQQTHNLKAMILGEMRLQASLTEAGHNKTNKKKSKRSFTLYACLLLHTSCYKCDTLAAIYRHQ